MAAMSRGAAKEDRPALLQKCLAAALLVLAAASALALLARHWLPDRFAAGPTALERPSPLRTDRLTAVYFHTHERCANCLRLEAWSHAAITEGFPAELADGRLEWETINFDLPQHRRFAAAYQLLAPTVVLVEMHGAAPGRWSAAPQLWNLLDDRPAFASCLQGEVRRRLDGAPLTQSSAAASWWVGLLLASWLGLQTAISPCPLATNIAAMSFLGRAAGSPRRALLSAALYALGRSTAYVAVAAALGASLAGQATLSALLRRSVAELLGPVMIAASALMLNLLPLSFSGVEISPEFHQRVRRWGLAGAFVVGLLFALSFCPYSAALFFSLIPMISQSGSWLAMPAAYGLATALPVAGLAVVLAVSLHNIGRAVRRMRIVERWARLGAGWAFLGVGLWLTLSQFFRLP